MHVQWRVGTQMPNNLLTAAILGAVSLIKYAKKLLIFCEQASGDMKLSKTLTEQNLSSLFAFLVTFVLKLNNQYSLSCFIMVYLLVFLK
jgi:hypothetical protein